MRTLFVNPNITPEITADMAAEARRAASPHNEIVPVTGSFGALYIANRIEAALAAHAVLDLLAEHAQGHDAVVVSAFGDPGVWAAKEMLDIPVIGVSEAAFHVARMLGRRYAIVCMTPRLRTWYVECAHEHGLADGLVAARYLPTPVDDVTRAAQDLSDAVLDQCRAAVEEDEAEVVIIGGGPLAGLAHRLAPHVSVPLVDGIACAVRLVEALAGLGLAAPRSGSFARPEPKPSKGLSPHLAAFIESKT